MKRVPEPPRLFLRFLRWFCDPALLPFVEGDLTELYHQRLLQGGKSVARRKFVFDVLLLFRPGIIKTTGPIHLNHWVMYKNYFKLGWRNLMRTKGYSVINIGGLSLGMAIAILIGMWIVDELTFNSYHTNYDRVVQIMKGATFEGKVYRGQRHLPFPLIDALETNYSANFKYVVPWAGSGSFLTVGEKTISASGAYAGKGAPEMLTLKMMSGTWSGLQDPSSIMLSQSTAMALFGGVDPLNKTIRVNDQYDLMVTGVYDDLPNSSSFYGVKFLGAWEFYHSNNRWMDEQGWYNHFLIIYGLLADEVDIERTNENIRDAEMNAIRDMPSMQQEVKFDPFVMVNPMSAWHLYSNYRDGSLDDGPIEFVRVVAIIGVFVLLLACINFMNLSTARSAKRSREVGIRKSIGSTRGQLASQFLAESILVVLLAFIVSLGVAIAAIPWFNTLTGKLMHIPWLNPWFWLISVVFIVVTGVVAGSYPALYLSSFNAVRVLKGTFRVGRYAALPRRVLVVMQFAVSVALVIGTVIIYKQVSFAKDRPVGYDRDGLIMVPRKSNDFFRQAEALRTELKKTGAVFEMAESGGPITNMWSGNGGFDWQGKDPNFLADFNTLSVSHAFGRTVGWEFIDGRDFSEDIISDSSGFVINEAAAKYMKIDDPVGKVVHWKNSAYNVDKDFRILGVIKDMVMESPFEPVEPAVYFVEGYHGWFVIKLNPEKQAQESLAKVEDVFKKLIPAAPFDYVFVDEDFARKFQAEERVSTLTAIFGTLAVVISCLGLFGLASFVSEQRTKEIGIRKVVGASVLGLWKLLTRDFVLLTLIGCVIAIPVSYLSLQSWLSQYTYQTEMSLWIFIGVSLAAVLVTLLTVSYQSIKAALANPVKSLRTE
jgi:ABC-type antimicrobial peptide transport system permease subunit